jgi:hypothetical protein
MPPAMRHRLNTDAMAPTSQRAVLSVSLSIGTRDSIVYAVTLTDRVFLLLGMITSRRGLAPTLEYRRAILE